MIHMGELIRRTLAECLRVTHAIQSNLKMTQLFAEADSDKFATPIQDTMDIMPSPTSTSTTSTALSMNHGTGVAKSELAEHAPATNALQEELPRQTGYDIDR